MVWFSRWNAVAHFVVETINFGVLHLPYC